MSNKTADATGKGPARALDACFSQLRAVPLACRCMAAPAVPPVGSLPLSKVCELEDFHRPDFQAWAHAVFPHEVVRFGQRFPESVEYRKHWEVVMAARSLASGGVLSRQSEVLGVGAGNEPTVFWLTQHVRRVFATDLYATAGWEESAVASMLVDPSRQWPSPWDRRRLVVQHMDARELCYVDGSFDGAFSCSSLEHFGNHGDIRQACDELCRVVRPGGVIGLSTELRLAGEGDGLPGTLLFSTQQLTEIVIDGRPWELHKPVQFSPSPATLATAGPLDDASADVRAHVERHGEIHFHELDWSHYPQIVLAHGDYLFTSVHLTLRRSGGSSRTARWRRRGANR